MIRKITALLAFVLLALPGNALAQAGYFGDAGNSFVQNVGAGQVNWQSMKLRVTGSGAPNSSAPNIAVARLGAERAAKADAFRNALESIQGVQVSAESTVQDFMLQSDTIKTRVEGTLRGFSVVDRKYFNDGGVEIIIEVALTGDIAAALLGDQGFAAAPGADNVVAAQAQGPVYTGLIVDASGLGAKPAMSPRIVDERGEEIYGTGVASRDFALDLGMVGYSRNVEKARANDRVSDNALVIKAVKTDGPAGTNIVISNADAEAIRSATQHLSFLSKCRVVVIL